jgi:transposase
LVQRVELITRTERRRRWSDEEKRAFVAEAFSSGAVVSHVARRHGVAESCLFSWRKRFAQLPTDALQDKPRLIPIMVDSPRPLPTSDVAMPQAACPAVITWADGTRLEVPAGYPAPALKALIAALRLTR